MTSPAIDNEKTVDLMMTALAPLSDDWLQFAQSRWVAYAKLGFNEKTVRQFRYLDRAAYRREILRRTMVAPTKQRNVA